MRQDTDGAGWLTDAMNTINAHGGLFREPLGVRVQNATKLESSMRLESYQVA